ncbi:MAG: ABC transporter ATP-binding protein, partial [Planctomycetota bacterium]
MTAIIGPNGAGKSTLLHAALGLVPMLRGEARFFGEPLSAVRRRVAFLPQRESIDWDFPITALEVVRMGATSGLGWWMPAWLDRLRGTREGLRAHAALEAVGMQEFARRPIGELSGGQQQRVFLARALAQEADLLLLDEPFAGIDATSEAVLMAELQRIAAAGGTVIAVHHDLEEVAARFDRAVLVDRTIRAEGPAGEVLAS